MRFDRNMNADGAGKYALVNMRAAREGGMEPGSDVAVALQVLEEAGVLEYGAVGSVDEFFVVNLKDQHSPGALLGYAERAERFDPEFAQEVRDMLLRAGENSRFCKLPD